MTWKHSKWIPSSHTRTNGGFVKLARDSPRIGPFHSWRKNSRKDSHLLLREWEQNGAFYSPYLIVVHPVQHGKLLLKYTNLLFSGWKRHIAIAMTTPRTATKIMAMYKVFREPTGFFPLSSLLFWVKTASLDSAEIKMKTKKLPPRLFLFQ